MYWSLYYVYDLIKDYYVIYDNDNQSDHNIVVFQLSYLSSHIITQEYKCAKAIIKGSTDQIKSYQSCLNNKLHSIGLPADFL